MTYIYAYLSVLAAFAVGGLMSFSYLAAVEQGKQRVRFSRRGRLLRKLVNDKDEVMEIDLLFNKYGINMTGKQYQTIRYTVLMLFVALWLINASLFKTNSIWGTFAVVFFLASVPRERFLVVKTPLHYFFNFYSKGYQKKRDLELYNLISQIKNIYITMDGGVGSDYVLREIMKYTRYTRNIFVKFASLWNVNKQEAAMEYFIEATQSDVGRDIAHIFDKLDNLKKHEILEQLTLYQTTVRQNKETYRAKAQETKSALFYTLSVFLVIAILLNMLITLVFSNLMHQFTFIMG